MAIVFFCPIVNEYSEYFYVFFLAEISLRPLQVLYAIWWPSFTGWVLLWLAGAAFLKDARSSLSRAH